MLCFSLVARGLNRAPSQIEPSNTSTDFVLDDGTGVVKCTKYLSEEDSDNQAQFSPHMYVRVYGALQVRRGFVRGGARLESER